MYSNKTKIWLVVLLVSLWGMVLSKRLFTPALSRSVRTKPSYCEGRLYNHQLNQAYSLLSSRVDKEAGILFDSLYLEDPSDIRVLWGKAELLRRARQINEAEKFLDQILKIDPQHSPSLLTLSYIRYQEEKLDQSYKLVQQALDSPELTSQDKAFAYMMLGAINGSRAENGWLFHKLVFGTNVKGYFLKARDLAPQMSEVHLALGSFYLKAPKVAGGDLNLAIDELKTAVKLAPYFAAANARLAQAYRQNGQPQMYNYYIQRAKELDPENEILQEVERG